jgi:hypothetical protein
MSPAIVSAAMMIRYVKRMDTFHRTFGMAHSAAMVTSVKT